MMNIKQVYLVYQCSPLVLWEDKETQPCMCQCIMESRIIFNIEPSFSSREHLKVLFQRLIQSLLFKKTAFLLSLPHFYTQVLDFSTNCILRHYSKAQRFLNYGEKKNIGRTLIKRKSYHILKYTPLFIHLTSSPFPPHKT